MEKIQFLCIGFGLLFVAAGVYAMAVGKLKWDEQNTLEGIKARLAGVVSAAAGGALAAVGWFAF